MAIKFFDLGFRHTVSVDYCFQPNDSSGKGKGKGKGKVERILWTLAYISLAVFFLFSLFDHIRPPSLISNENYTGSIYFANDNETSLIFLSFSVLAGLAFVLGVAASFLYFLRKHSNPLYWEIGCWFLVAVGILIRPIVVSGTELDQTIISGAILAGIISLATFPVLIRFLNELKPEPGLIHVSLPFSFGFFLDVAQLLAISYIPNLAFLS